MKLWTFIVCHESRNYGSDWYLWLEDLIHLTILSVPHSVEVNVPFWKNDLDWQCKSEPDDMSNTHFLDISETAQILQHHRHHRFFNHSEIDWQFMPNPDDMTNTHFIYISETAQILQHLWHHKFFNHSEIDWQFKPNPDDMTNTHFIYISETAPPTPQIFNTLNLKTWPSSRPWFFQDVCLAFEIFFVQVHLFRTITKK